MSTPPDQPGPTAPTGDPAVPLLTDGVVTLRGHRADDVQRVWEQCQGPDSVRWTGVPSPYSHADAADFVASTPRSWEQDTEWSFAIEYAGRFAGTISLRNETAPGEPATAEIAYGAHPDVRGAGVMERAARLILGWGFRERRLERVVWWAHRGNWASRRLAWKVGFSFDGTVRRYLAHRGELVDGWVGTLLRGEAHSARSRWLEPALVAGDGLVLRPFRADDVDRLVEGSADPVTQHWLGFLPRDPGPEYGWSYLETAAEEYAVASALRWAVSATVASPLLGTVGLFRIRECRDGEIGYWLHPDARGRGLARRAAALGVGHAFETLGFDRVTGYATATNLASRRVLESLGMRLIGLERGAARTGDGEVEDLAGYDLLATEWAG
ncbi:MAG: GNAT family N-acetyltransferase [Nocardioides sp.]|uniref:GNAT family N-acetyltransferase n=1 Tax=Nocardioides sp. TaxID=35761 RepID=UPI0039E2AED5